MFIFQLNDTDQSSTATYDGDIDSTAVDIQDEGFATEEEETGPQTPVVSETALEMSVLTHDYLGGSVCTISRLVDKAEQTEMTFSTDTSSQTSTRVTVDTGTQTDFVYVSSYKPEENRDHFNSQPVMKDFSVQCEKPPKTIEDIENSNEKCMFYTGVPNAKILYALFDEMTDVNENTTRNRTNSECNDNPRDRTYSESGGRPRRLRLIDEFFLVLMRLRLGLLLEDLADRFFIAKSTCGNIVDKWLDYLHVKFSFLVTWPSKSVIMNTMPNKFRRKYPDCRVIIDCTEIYTETPQSLINKSLLYSHYKSHMTYKVLLGISPSGVITFVSDLWAGSTSDKQITKLSGLLDLCEPGDAIMADKGFLISDLTTPRGIKLIIPPFKTKRFTRREIEETRRIANLRIDVERAMERVKNFRILSGVIPITLSKKTSKTFKICAGLSNLQNPLVHDDVNDDM